MKNIKWIVCMWVNIFCSDKESVTSPSVCNVSVYRLSHTQSGILPPSGSSVSLHNQKQDERYTDMVVFLTERYFSIFSTDSFWIFEEIK